jgi:hypothetical protein
MFVCAYLPGLLDQLSQPVRLLLNLTCSQKAAVEEGYVLAKSL